MFRFGRSREVRDVLNKTSCRSVTRRISDGKLDPQRLSRYANEQTDGVRFVIGDAYRHCWVDTGIRRVESPQYHGARRFLSYHQDTKPTIRLSGLEARGIRGWMAPPT